MANKIERDDVINAFLKGNEAKAQSHWEAKGNALFFNKVAIATRNPTTLSITKMTESIASNFFTGSSLAAVRRVLKSIELHDLVTNDGTVLVKNLPFFDAIKVKKTLKRNDTNIVSQE